jgi:hypothetical protein
MLLILGICEAAFNNFIPLQSELNCNLKWQNWMVGIFVAFGVQLLLVVVATVAFAKLC